MDSFLVPKAIKLNPNNKTDNKDDKLEYMIFVWNGKHTSSLLQSHCMSKAFELEDFIQRSEGPFLEVFFRNQKLNHRSCSQEGSLRIINYELGRFYNRFQIELDRIRIPGKV